MWQAQFATNFFGPINVTRAILPHMRERKQGTLVFMGSFGRWQGYPHAAPYVSGKAALSSKSKCDQLRSSRDLSIRSGC